MKRKFTFSIDLLLKRTLGDFNVVVNLDKTVKKLRSLQGKAVHINFLFFILYSKRNKA